MTVLRFENEAEDLLHLFKNEGLAPGKEGKVAEVDAEHVVVAFDDGNATLTRSVSETVSVLADPSPPPRTALPEQLVLAKERYGALGDAASALASDQALLAALDEAAQAVERVPDVDEARVERRDAEPDRVRPAEVGDHVRALDQRAADRPRLGVAERDVRAAARGVARRAELEAERRQPLVVQRHDQLALRDRLLAQPARRPPRR